MKHKKILLNFSLIIALVTASPMTLAGDFDWLKELNIKAVNDGDGFRTRLAARFQVGNAQIDTVINNVANPSDAYMVLRLGEMSGRTTDKVLKVYNANNKQGWGAMAKSLGIKPGSKEFRALKKGGDLHDGDNKAKDKNKGKDKSKDKDTDEQKAKDKQQNMEKNKD